MVFICNILTVLFNVTSTSNKRNRLFHGDYNLKIENDPENQKTSFILDGLKYGQQERERDINSFDLWPSKLKTI